jgi:two-component system response regulator RegX3
VAGSERTTPGARVMIVEDDPAVRTVVGDHLRAAGYRVDPFAAGDAAWEALRAQIPDVIVLDRMLPRLSGDELCRRVRGFSDVPILMLTALGTVDHRIEGLEHGADDYLPKPFSLRELQLRLEALLRRRLPDAAPVAFTAGVFRVDPAHRRLRIGDREIALTSREYELFLFLLGREGHVVRRDEILREVWGWSEGDASTVTVHVRRLREKIEPDPTTPRFLRTEWGAGYRLETGARGGAGQSRPAGHAGQARPAEQTRRTGPAC